MKRFGSLTRIGLPLLLAGLCYFVVTQQDELQDTRADVRKVAMAMADAERQEHVIQLPEDGQQFYLTIFTAQDYLTRARDRELVAWFDSDPTLKSLKSQTQYNHYTPDQKIYSERFGETLPISQFPAVMLQDAAGKVYVKLSAATLPKSPKDLIKIIRDCCPRPKPGPQPTPTPEPNPVPVIPDIGPPDLEPEVPEEDGGVGLFALLAALAGGGLGVVNEWKKTHGGL